MCNFINSHKINSWKNIVEIGERLITEVRTVAGVFNDFFRQFLFKGPIGALRLLLIQSNINGVVTIHGKRSCQSYSKPFSKKKKKTYNIHFMWLSRKMSKAV